MLDINEEELEMIKFSLNHVHDADLSEFGEDNIKTLESLMDKLDMKYPKWVY